ncbi:MULTISPECIES: YbjN domain-containing protein [unclassified Micromonospora]|uniref:YbjN domain-containing protein n=1 Tax=unclassified Micromonospora TaxID=2617518 RepID=UPI003A856489
MTAKELVQALDEATDLPDGDGKIAELERIAAHADAAGQARIGFDARMALIETYNHHTERWRMLPAFGWCLSTFDRYPELFEPWDAELLRWYHKWAVATLRGTPRVGLAQTRAALDDMERRFTASGQSLQAVYNLRCKIADHVGDEAQARQWLDRWRTAPRDENSDCAGCDPSRQAELLAGWGEWEAALAIVEPVLSGAVGCTEQPEKALVTVIMPYLRLGRYADAAQAHVRAYRRHRHERDAFPYLAEHLRFCASVGQHQRGLAILTEHLEWFDRPYDDASAMEFAAAGALVCRLAAAAGHGDETIHRPEYGDRPAADLPVATLGSQLAAAATELAGRFDTRNGTDHQSRRIAGWLAAEPLTDAVELPADQPTTGGEIGVPPAGGTQDVVSPLTLEGITAALNERGDRYFVDDNGVVGGKWGHAVIHFERLGEQQRVLHSRVLADRRLPADRLAEAYRFCNSWNHDRLLPKVYVHDTGSGELILAGDVSTDLAYGVSGAQLAALVNAAVITGAQFADAVAELP